MMKSIDFSQGHEDAVVEKIWCKLQKSIAAMEELDISDLDEVAGGFDMYPNSDETK